jgi:tripartite-type tricarboxylate transporter receptor subunit TctC
MMLKRRNLLATTVAAFAYGLVATTMLASSAAKAETYPTKPIRLLVPYAAGGGTDAIARVIAQGVGEKLGQQILVENNGTAGGNVATQQAAKADPDGYTILMANQGPMAVNPHLFKNVKLDPLTAFDPVTLIAAAPLVVVVPEQSSYTSLKQLVEAGQKEPGKLTYGSAGNGSASHLATLLLAQAAKLDMVHVPYNTKSG